MLTAPVLDRILRAGAMAVDHVSACIRCGADEGEPCAGDEADAVTAMCPGRVSGDPVLAAAMRGMAKQCRIEVGDPGALGRPTR